MNRQDIAYITDNPRIRPYAVAAPAQRAGRAVSRRSATGRLHPAHALYTRDVVATREQQHHHAHNGHRENQLPHFHRRVPFSSPSERAVHSRVPGGSLPGWHTGWAGPPCWPASPTALAPDARPRRWPVTPTRGAGPAA